MPEATTPDWDAIDALYDEARDADVTGDTERAVMLYRRLLALDPADHLGVALRLAPLTGEVPGKAPDAYVAALFDQTADRFDAILVDELGYAVPLMIADRLAALGLGPFPRWLDLGCGTGLCALALEEVTEARTGVDLAPTMVEIAAELDLYGRLFVGEAVRFLESRDGGPDGAAWDLVTAADVLPYLGDLAPLLAALGRHVRAGTVLALSTEWHEAAPGAPGWRVGPHKRFAHDGAYLRDALDAAGWTILSAEPITVRTEQDEPVPGELVVARHR